jgi:SAM-dependent methyltransferase
MTTDMKGDWNRRARENAQYYIATSVEGTEAAFNASGARDVGHFFDGIESLLHPQQDAVDVGCGIGRMDQFVAPRVRRLVGIDVSGEMVAQARARLGHLPNVEFVEGDGWTLRPLADGAFGLVFSHIVFQHLPRPVAASYFADARRVLHAGGEFVFQMPERVPGAPDDPPDEDTFEMRFYSEPALRRMLEELGFEWIECRRWRVETPRLDFNQMRIRVRK